MQLHLNFNANRGKPSAMTEGGLTLNDPNSNPKLTRHCYALAASLRSFQKAEAEHQHYLERHSGEETCIDFARFRACLGL